MISSILAIAVLVVALPLNLFATTRLLRLARLAPEIRVLRERAVVALVLTVNVAVFAGIFLNNGMEVPLLDVEATRVITRTMVLALSVPAVYWLFLYWDGRRSRPLAQSDD